MSLQHSTTGCKKIKGGEKEEERRRKRKKEKKRRKKEKMRRMVKNGEKGGYRDGKNVNEKKEYTIFTICLKSYS